MQHYVTMCCVSAKANRNFGTICAFMFSVPVYTGLSTGRSLGVRVWQANNLAQSHHVHPVSDVWACTDRAFRLEVLAHNCVHLVSWHAVSLPYVQIDRVACPG